MTTHTQQEHSPPSPVGQERQPQVPDLGFATLMIEFAADVDAVLLPGILTVVNANGEQVAWS
jgi:hypothetical protein